MRRGTLSALVLAGVLVLAGCGGGGGTSTTSPESSQSTTTEDTTRTTSQTTTQATTGTTTQPASTAAMRIVIVGGVPEGGIVRKTVRKGDRVVVLVTSDVADEVHVHGYDLKGNVAPGRPARIAFVAKVPGRFEIELENRSLQIGDLTVES